MKQVISAKEIEEILKNGGDFSSLPADAIITPSARDLMKGERPLGKPNQPAAPSKSKGERPLVGADAGGDKPGYFESKNAQILKEQICDIGRRLWAREYVDGNGGNISIRVGPNQALCTPTLVSKGFMKPEDICLVDLDGEQLAGRLRRTSEILMHLAIMKSQPRAMSCVHCHPPYSTAFAVAGVKPPNNFLPEFEVFIGEVPIAEYFTPGTPEMGKRVAELADDHNTILMANHGVVSWSHVGVEDAYFKMEILEAYVRTVMVTSELGKTPNTFTGPQMKDLLNIKQSLGVPDPRFNLKEAELAADDQQWRPGVTCIAAKNEECACNDANDPEAETVVKQITDIIMQKME